MFTWWDPATGKLQFYFENQIQTDDGETGQICLKVLCTSFQNHARVYPQHTQAIIKSDGAAYYQGADFCAGLAYMGKKVGVRVIEHHTGEPYGGKSHVDRYFYIGKYRVRWVVKYEQGKKDANNFYNLAQILIDYPTQDTITLLSGPHKDLSSMQAPIKDVFAHCELRKQSLRTYEYGDDGGIARINFFLSSGLSLKPTHTLAVGDVACRADGRVTLYANPADVDTIIPSPNPIDPMLPLQRGVIQNNRQAMRAIGVVKEAGEKEMEKLRKKESSEEKFERGLALQNKEYEDRMLTDRLYCMNTKRDEQKGIMRDGNPNCVFSCSSEKKLRDHVNKQACFMNGTGVTNPKIKIQPTQYARLSIGDLAKTLLQGSGPTNASLAYERMSHGTSRKTCLDWFGWARRDKDVQTAIDPEVKKVVESLHRWALENKKPAIRADSMLILLEKVGTEQICRDYPDVPILRNMSTVTNGAKRWEEHQLPLKSQVNGLWMMFNQKVKQEKEWAKYTPLQGDNVAPTVHECLTNAKDSFDAPFRTKEAIDLMASEVAHRYVTDVSLGNNKPIQCWSANNLTALPISKDTRYPMSHQQKMLAALKMIPEVPPRSKSKFRATEIVIHESKVEYMNERNGAALVEEVVDYPDDGLDERDWYDGDDNDEARKNPPNIEKDRHLGAKGIFCAKEYFSSDPIRLTEVWREQRKIGEIFYDDGDYFKVTRVVVYEKDKDKWLWFEYYKLSGKYAGEWPAVGDPPTVENHMDLYQYTRCCHFQGGKFHNVDVLEELDYVYSISKAEEFNWVQLEDMPDEYM